MLAPPVVWTDGHWATHEKWDVQVNGVTLHIPKGFVTDLASIPRILRGFINTYELGGVGPPLIHDAIYAHRGKLTLRFGVLNPDGGVTPRPWTTPPTRFTRRAADRIFREAMKQAGVGLFKRTVAWVAVRGFGWVPWPPSRSTWRNVATRAGWTLVQASAAVGAYLLFGWPVWSVPVVAAGLSAVKTLTQSSMGDRVKGVIYR